MTATQTPAPTITCPTPKGPPSERATFPQGQRVRDAHTVPALGGTFETPAPTKHPTTSIPGSSERAILPQGRRRPDAQRTAALGGTFRTTRNHHEQEES